MGQADSNPAPRLIIIGGLPATGKTTIATHLAREVHAAFVRVDTIEQAILGDTQLTQPLGPVGYIIGYAIAGDQLRNGLSVVADSVNPLAVTRAAWRHVAGRHDANVVEVEVVCSDPAEHRRRAETRIVDIPDLRLPTWQNILDRAYEAWDSPRIVVDTATAAANECVAAIRRQADL